MVSSPGTEATSAFSGCCLHKHTFSDRNEHHMAKSWGKRWHNEFKSFKSSGKSRSRSQRLNRTDNVGLRGDTWKLSLKHATLGMVDLRNHICPFASIDELFQGGPGWFTRYSRVHNKKEIKQVLCMRNWLSIKPAHCEQFP